MPRFFLHLRNSSGIVRDEDGRELENLDAAHQEAVDALQVLLAADPDNFDPSSRFLIETQDQRTKLIVAVSEALPNASP